MTLVDKKPLFKRDKFNQQVILPIHDEELKSVVSTITNCDTKQNQPNIGNNEKQGEQGKLKDYIETHDSGEGKKTVNESHKDQKENEIVGAI